VRRRRACGVVVLAAALLAACTTLPQVARVEEGDNDSTLELKNGQLLEIRLRNPGRGIRIALGSVVAPVLTLVGEPTLHDDTVQAGVSGTGNYESWIFRAIQPGTVNVRMDFRMQWETTGIPSRSVTYHVTVE